MDLQDILGFFLGLEAGQVHFSVGEKPCKLGVHLVLGKVFRWRIVLLLHCVHHLVQLGARVGIGGGVSRLDGFLWLLSGSGGTMSQDK